MLQKLFQHFQSFSKQNWWIYFLLLFAVGIVFYTGKGNIYEIIGVLFLNILGNLFILLMQDSYKDNKFNTGAYFLLFGNIIYFTIAVYSALVNKEYQYLLWQFGFQLSGIKIYFQYIGGINIKVLNSLFFILLSFITLFIAVIFLELELYQIIQSFGFACAVVGLGTLDDMQRFWALFLGNFFITSGAYLGLYTNFLSGNVFGVTISFTILGTATFLFYAKLLPIYISRLKKL